MDINTTLETNDLKISETQLYLPSSVLFGLCLTSEDAARFPCRPAVFDLKNGGVGGFKIFKF